MPIKPTIARIWRGHTRRDVADAYQAYLQAEGIPPLLKTARGVQQLREDRDEETWFTTISYWTDIDVMTAFTKGDPTKVHHLARDAAAPTEPGVQSQGPRHEIAASPVCPSGRAIALAAERDTRWASRRDGA